MPLSTGQRLLRHDRRLGVRFVAGADEAGRGSLAGPLVVAGVLLDYEALRGHRVRPLALLNDSKQVEPVERERLYHAVVAAASRISIRVIAAREIDANGLHRSNLWGLRTVLSDHEGAPDSICRHPAPGDAVASKTVFWCIADVTDGRITFGRGNPCDSVAQDYAFAPYAA